ncbi:hypothetical protein [Streptomyces sp. NPDC003710]
MERIVTGFRLRADTAHETADKVLGRSKRPKSKFLQRYSTAVMRMRRPGFGRRFFSLV